ncbi:exodeoxyribonuclease VII, small subunit [Methanohalobium evestigatum Z-7303]|uniref:Exodeoxyribonuclease VII, small subunit n=1 Tax=Methanohalobium evestigatum (strain ATCC BAA-1072 / DSM 3721 / NBRC 107634 / OCM 161 / Z-7303) TaxID=644295 RepID=D7EB76_METEZ|nr:exodeoxyribonuclease VII small subunit [Methanohalobium evestigatum]ADI74593.1 exodeoxyribonuclease VII, small subunit [Methanohalobium evestigatum Z-7303]
MPEEDNDDTRFEDSLEELEQIVKQLENGDLTLDESLETFEYGIKLVQKCNSKINMAEKKIEELIEENSELKTKQFTEFDD